MRRAVGADKSAAIEREYDVQILERDIVNHLIDCPLHERRINRRHGMYPSVAMPAAKVMPCCSAIPTSKYLSGTSR